MSVVTSPRRFLTVLLLLVGTAALALPAGAQNGAPPPPPEAREPAPPAPPAEGQQEPPDQPVLQTPEVRSAPEGRRYLLLPDISLISNLNGHLSNDNRDSDRDRLRLDEAELAIQSFVYPGIRADAFIVFTEGEAALEEGFLTVQNVGLRGVPLSATVGRRKVPFGRVNQLHPHSWLYVVQPYALSNLVAGESLTGDGAYLSYLLPTPFFAQLDAGFWSGGGGHGHGEEEDHEDEEEGESSAEIISSPGAGFEDRFLTLRLWTGFPILGGELEIGGSLARGKGESLLGGDAEEGPNGAALAQVSRGRQVALAARPSIELSGLDLSYRRAGRGASRLLLRGEYVQHRQKAGTLRQTAHGYYLFADQRLDAQNSLGLRYDWSEFPSAPGQHESALSLIGTRQLTEQTYLRLQLIRGNRPGRRNFNEVWFQWVWGVGPHTHNLE